MENRTHIGKKITALVLFIALSFPMAVQFFHMFEGHEHVACTETTTHMHELTSSCDLCSFHLTSADYTLVQYPDLNKPVIPAIIEETIDSFHISSFYYSNTQLRAPPVLS